MNPQNDIFTNLKTGNVDALETLESTVQSGYTCSRKGR